MRWWRAPLAVAASTCAAATLAVAQPTPCRMDGLRNEVLCGSVERPLDPARRDGTRIAVHYVVVPATARRKLPDAVILLAGGPGQSAIELAPKLLPLFARLNHRRDIVFVDQRGTGRSAPLACDEAPRLADPRTQEALLLECRDRLARLPGLGGADGLRHFTTWIAMQDLEAVRQQLGGAPVNLVGVSYGTRAALEFMRQFPRSVRRAVLDGVAPPGMVLPVASSADAQSAFDAMFAACEAEAACARRFPSLRADWAALLARLPVAATVPDPLTGPATQVTRTRDLLLRWGRGPLSAPSVAAALPAALDEAARGRFAPLAGLAALVEGRREAPVFMGMHLSVVCAEDAPRMASATERPGVDFGTTFADSYARICEAWPRGEVPAAFYRIAAGTVPVLLFSGGLDPATPPRHGRQVAAALGANALHVEVANAGHGVLAIGCARDLLFRFVDAASDTEALQLDAGCVKSIPRPGSFLPPVAPR